MIFLVETVAAPDQYFWYTLSSLLAAVLIYILWRYVGKTEKSIEKLTESIGQLTVITKLHEHRITVMEEK
ncbi:MAG TPA: hypothetical protein VFD46_07065 [Chryseolinea sp.]|nr:hypothetical protein [Chryseolinea sp.]